MKNIQAILKSYLKKISSDLHSAIVSIIVGFILLSVGGVFLFSKNLWSYIITTIQSPTPLWGTTAFVVIVLVYIYLKTQKAHSSPSIKNYKIRYFTIGNYKWKTKIYDSGYFEVDKYPYCVTHDLQFIFSRNGKYCPGPENEGCNNTLSKREEFEVYESAKSIIENRVRNKNY